VWFIGNIVPLNFPPISSSMISNRAHIRHNYIQCESLAKSHGNRSPFARDVPVRPCKLRSTAGIRWITTQPRCVLVSSFVEENVWHRGISGALLRMADVARLCSLCMERRHKKWSQRLNTPGIQWVWNKHEWAPRSTSDPHPCSLPSIAVSLPLGKKRRSVRVLKRLRSFSDRSRPIDSKHDEVERRSLFPRFQDQDSRERPDSSAHKRKN